MTEYSSSAVLRTPALAVHHQGTGAAPLERTVEQPVDHLPLALAAEQRLS